MQSRREKSGYWLVLGKGEEIESSVSNWAKKQGIKGAQIWGIGAVEGAVLGHFDIRKKKFATEKFPGSHEILSFIGNISEDGLHAHLSIAGGDFAARGGHLMSARISIVGEFFVLPTSRLGKIPLPAFGLRQIELGKYK